MRTHGLANLYAGQSHSARCSEHQQLFACLEPSALSQRVIRSCVGHGESRSGRIVDPVRQCYYATYVGCDLLCEAAPACKCHHSVSHAKLRDSCPDFFDDACHFTAWSEWHWRFKLVFAADQQRVWETDAAHFYADHY